MTVETAGCFDIDEIKKFELAIDDEIGIDFERNQTNYDGEETFGLVVFEVEDGEQFIIARLEQEIVGNDRLKRYWELTDG